MRLGALCSACGVLADKPALIAIGLNIQAYAWHRFEQTCPDLDPEERRAATIWKVASLVGSVVFWNQFVPFFSKESICHRFGARNHRS
jgi:hypothetical protein